MTYVSHCCPRRNARSRRATDNTPGQLLSTVAHEIRTPLTAIRLTTELLLGDLESMSHNEAADMLGRIQRSTLWLHSLADNLSFATGAALRQLPQRRKPVCVMVCIDEAAGVVQPFLGQKGQSLRITRRAPVTQIGADPTHVGQALVNVLVNASKYSVPGDVVELDVSADDEYVAVDVTDHGPGIAPDEQRRVFEPYVRGAQAASGGPGLGLGLSIVRMLVEMHGGSVALRSAPGAGTTVTLRFPVWRST